MTMKSVNYFLSVMKDAKCSFFKIIYGFGILNLPDGRQAGFGHCNLFDICDLLFVISGKEIPILSS